MDPMFQRNDAGFPHSQLSNKSFDNRSAPNVIHPAGMSSSPVVNRTRPLSQMDEKWKTSSPSLSSNDKSGWKTTSSQNNKSTESWKMSTKPRFAQLPNIPNEDPNFKRHSAMPDMISTGRPKPLPQEPMMPTSEPFNLNLPLNESHSPAPFHLNTPAQPPAFIQPNQFSDFSTPIQSHMHPLPMNNNFSSPYLPNEMMYTPSNIEYPPPMNHHSTYSQSMPQQPPTQMMDANYQSPIEYHQPLYNHNLNTQPIVNDQPPPQETSPKKDTSPTKEDKKRKKAEKRQITVQSINPEHRVWIDVLPNETGKSLAEKIHIIATFRTRKIVSITSASGRKIPIDNRPVFGNWVDMEKFEDGERWAVEWRANDKSVVDRFFSKVVQGK